MRNTLERIAKCQHKTKTDKRSGFWQVDLTAARQELLAFITPKGPAFWASQRPGSPRETDEQNVVHTEAQTSCTEVDFPEVQKWGPTSTPIPKRTTSFSSAKAGAHGAGTPCCASIHRRQVLRAICTSFLCMAAPSQTLVWWLCVTLCRRCPACMA